MAEMLLTRLEEIRARLATETPTCELPTQLLQERCNACPSCVAVQDLVFLLDTLEAALRVVEAAQISEDWLISFGTPNTTTSAEKQAIWERLHDALTIFTQHTEQA